MSNRENTEEMKMFWRGIQRQAKRALINLECAYFDGSDIQAANSAEIHNLSNQLIEKAKQLDEVEQL